MKNNLKKLAILSFQLVLLFGTFLLIMDGKDGLNPPVYKDCGVVEKKMTVEHGRSRSDLILLVNFEKTGEKAIEVSTTSYMKHEPGDRVCFTCADQSKLPMHRWILLYKFCSVFILLVWIVHLILYKFLMW
jgi:hypothetical protein